MIHRRHNASPTNNSKSGAPDATIASASHQGYKARRTRLAGCFASKRTALVLLVAPFLVWSVWYSVSPFQLNPATAESAHTDAFPRTMSARADAFRAFPRTMGIHGRINKNRNSGHGRGPGRRLDRYARMQTTKQRKALADSDDYDDKARDPLYEGECEPMHPWQEALFPSCNVMHEMGFGHVREEASLLRKINSGGYNDVLGFKLDLPPHGEEIVLKVLTYGTEYTDRNFDRVRRDAIISERLTKSKYIVDILGHCGLSELAPIGGHTMSEEMNSKLDRKTKLKLATIAALGLADLHNIDGDGVPSVTHGDLKNNQYLMVDGQYRLGDFNRGRFLRKNRNTGEPCTYTIGKNDAKYRSPEEYRSKYPLSAKIDVWALGSMIFRIYTGYTVWHGHDTKKTQKKIAKKEVPPPLPDDFRVGTDPINVLLHKVMYEMCFVPKVESRATAMQVATYLVKESKKLGYDFRY